MKTVRLTDEQIERIREGMGWWVSEAGSRERGIAEAAQTSIDEALASATEEPTINLGKNLNPDAINVRRFTDDEIVMLQEWTEQAGPYSGSAEEVRNSLGYYMGGGDNIDKQLMKVLANATEEAQGKDVRLYYHKTDGGAEYLCSSHVPGTDEGAVNSDTEYIVRIDGDIREFDPKTRRYMDYAELTIR